MNIITTFPFPISLKELRETSLWARALGETVQPNDFLILEGPLGVGKTEFVRGLALGLQVPKTIPVGSPSFTIINEYAGRLPLYHLDLYRLEHESELLELGLTELAEAGGVVAIEWITKFPTQIPPEYLKISLSFGKRRTERLLSAETNGVWAKQRLEAWMAATLL